MSEDRRASGASSCLASASGTNSWAPGAAAVGCACCEIALPARARAGWAGTVCAECLLWRRTNVCVGCSHRDFVAAGRLGARGCRLLIDGGRPARRPRSHVARLTVRPARDCQSKSTARSSHHDTDRWPTASRSLCLRAAATRRQWQDMRRIRPHVLEISDEVIRCRRIGVPVRFIERSFRGRLANASLFGARRLLARGESRCSDRRGPPWIKHLAVGIGRAWRIPCGKVCLTGKVFHR